jgi:hypothetical protein
MDQELENNKSLPKNTILIWATDSEGFILITLIDKLNPALLFKWQRVPSIQLFKYVSIGLNLRVWGISLSGDVYYRYGVDRKSNFCGTHWEFIEPPSEELNIKFKCLSVGNETVWAVSTNDELYFRENITKFFHEGFDHLTTI